MAFNKQMEKTMSMEGFSIHPEVVAAIIGSVTSLIIAIGALATTEVFKKKKKLARNLLSALQLEELYIAEIQQLRTQPNKDGGKPKGIKDEFRHKAYAAGVMKIDETIASVKNILHQAINEETDPII